MDSEMDRVRSVIVRMKVSLESGYCKTDDMEQ